MRPGRPAAFGLILAAAAVSLGPLASASALPAVQDRVKHLAEDTHWRRDGGHGHGHNGGHHAQPIVELNETELAMWHSPTPVSYYTFDFEAEGAADAKRHPGFMMAHIVFMSLAFFGALPIGIILRSTRHPAHSVSMLAFYGLTALGFVTSGIYKKMTPNLYEGSVHGKQGYFVLFLAICLSTIDIIAGVTRLVNFCRADEKSARRFWRHVILNQDVEEAHPHGPEYTGLIIEDPDEYEIQKLGHPSGDSPLPTPLPTEDETEQWANEVRRHASRGSAASERTLFGVHRSNSSDTLNEAAKEKATPRAGLLKAGQFAFTVLERSIVLAGFGMTLTGIVVYTGGCRESYVNGCLAHLIKGGIFWCYGLLTFARFLGSFAEFGWAWNRNPNGFKYTAEFTESFVIFLYGITNTWMERFGAKPGDPYTTKQVQHISIAVMFWFAGLVGMGIESKRVRRWLASSTFSAVSPDLPKDAVEEPASYMGSFNPFPALVIGVTGAAMAAHFQTYLFQVEIHKLWGTFLVAFSVLRCLTYFFLWLGPPKSILPSRPPTEALGKEVTIAAMRRGRDDVMMFLNVAVAITCLAFCWTLCMVGLKGYLKSRSHSSVTYRSTHPVAA
ncbi:hypothetical protein NMY22_g8269 [Coprinellus aureogranulatus]|nr:hypothetical protein NMY22_g8269 [Coprinellus aureogranulatus]